MIYVSSDFVVGFAFALLVVFVAAFALAATSESQKVTNMNNFCLSNGGKRPYEYHYYDDTHIFCEVLNKESVVVIKAFNKTECQNSCGV